MLFPCINLVIGGSPSEACAGQWVKLIFLEKKVMHWSSMFQTTFPKPFSSHSLPSPILVGVCLCVCLVLYVYDSSPKELKVILWLV